MKLFDIFFKRNNKTANIALKRINSVVSNDNEISSKNLELIRNSIIDALKEHLIFDEKDLKIRGKYTGQDKTTIALSVLLTKSKAQYEIENVSMASNNLKGIQNKVDW